MRKILTIIFALVLFVLAILIQLDLITILTVTATSLNATPTSVYVLWTILLLFENLTYSFFINNATIILLISNLLILISFGILFLLYRHESNLSKRRYTFQTLGSFILTMIRTLDNMIIHHTNRLHERMDDDRTHKLKSTFL